MAENVIAIILPEYDDKENIITSDEWKRDFLLNDNQIGEYIKNLAAFVDFFCDEDCKLIYDSKNVTAFSFVLRTIPECYPSRDFQLKIALKKATNWRKYRESDEGDEYSIGYERIKDEVRCELIAKKIKNNKHSCLLVTHIPEFKNKIWKISKDGQEYDLLSYQLNILEVFNWISHHHKPPRIYNWNPKHGENGCGAHKKHAGEDVSILLCSREHAAELLSKAIGLEAWDLLYNYDSIYNRYMEFKAECKYEHLHSATFERKYHSYHLSSEEDIPKRIINKLKILGCIRD